MTTFEKLTAKVIPDAVRGCWLWCGATWQGHPYPMAWHEGKKVRAHRLMHEVAIGPVPDGMVVMHSCDNPMCVNPDHLQAGTGQQNTHDMISKGRGAIRGESNGRARLTEDDVRAIRADQRINRVIAADYGVTKSAIGMIKRRVNWRHVQ